MAYEPTRVHVTDVNDQPDPEELRHPDTAELLTLEVAKALAPEVKARIYYEVEWPDGRVSIAWPFLADNFFAEPELGPAMSRARLEGMGMTDEELQQERAKLLGEEKDRLRLSSSEEDTYALQAERRRVFDLVMDRTYG